MLDEQGVLETVTQKLDSGGINYMVTGSIAANFYTTPRMTRDIDIVVEIRETDTERLVTLFSGDFYIDPSAVKNAFQGTGMFNIIHQDAVIKIDFIIRKDSEYRQVEFRRRRVIVFEGRKISVVSPEDLILSKLDWARESLSDMQIRDVKNLLRTVTDLDMSYIKQWVVRLGLREMYEEINQ